MTDTLTSRARSKTAPSVLQSIRRPQAEPIRIEPARLKRPGLAIGSAALVAICMAVFALVYTQSVRRVSVIEVARPVMQGQLLTSSDLREAEVGAAGATAVVPFANLQQVLGRAATVSLVSGALLAPGDVGTTGTPGAGDAVVGIDLKPGMLPASGVEPGETVMIVLTGPSGSPISAQAGAGSGSSGTGDSVTSLSPSVIGMATVVAVDQSPTSDGDTVVSVELSSGLAPAVADASAADQVALIEVAPQS